MLHRMEEVRKTKIHAKDGDIGHVDEFYFDDEKWTVRYLVIDTASWIFGRKVLISPFSVESVAWGDSRVHLNLTKDQIKNAPDIDTAKPISRLQESEYNRYYGIPYYWGGTGMWGNAALPAAIPVGLEPSERMTDDERAALENTHLRSSNEVIGYGIQASDGSIGHVEDFVFEDDTWAIRYVIVDTKNLLPGKKVMLSTQWVSSVDWDESAVYMNLSKDQIRNAPEYDPSQPIGRDYEQRLYEHYGEDIYWL